MSEQESVGKPAQPSWPRRHSWWTALGVVLLGLVALLLLMAFLPVSVEDTEPVAPAADHDTAVARIDEIAAAELAQGDLNPICLSKVMTHGERTEKVIVFFHGFTSCPEQFRELGEQFYAAGYNVYIPRLPYHGAADRMSDMLLDTNAEELTSFATRSINIAHGLGDEVIAAGLSGGGTITGWVAQTHPEVDRAVLVAPFLGIGFIPAALNRPLARIIDNIPGIWMWWDPTTKAANPFTEAYAYPRYPLHALAEYLRLGFATQQIARSTPPAAAAINVIMNENDESVHNGITAQLIDVWESHGAQSMRTFSFEKTLNLPHDLITPTREDGNPALVYPIVIDTIEAP